MSDTQERASSATPPATMPAPARRDGPTRSWRKIAASAAAKTTLVSRTAATPGAAARRSAKRKRQYATNDPAPAATVVPVTCARSGAVPRRRRTYAAERDRHRRRRQLEVRDRRRVVKSLLVDERVRGDRAADRQRDRHPGRAVPEAAHEQDARCDEADAESLAGGHVRAEHDGAADQHQHRRRPARDGIDEGEVAPPVRGDQQREVGDLECGRRCDVRNRGALHRPRRRRDRREQQHRERHPCGGPRPDVVGAVQEHVPARMQHRRREREGERVERHERAPATRRGRARARRR